MKIILCSEMTLYPVNMQELLLKTKSFFFRILEAQTVPIIKESLCKKKGKPVILQNGGEFSLGEVVLRYTAFVKLSLFIVKGSEIGKEFPLEADGRDIRIGRTAKENDIIFTNQSVSGKHARITFEKGNSFLKILEAQTESITTAKKSGFRKG